MPTLFDKAYLRVDPLRGEIHPVASCTKSNKENDEGKKPNVPTLFDKAYLRVDPLRGEIHLVVSCTKSNEENEEMLSVSKLLVS